MREIRPRHGVPECVDWTMVSPLSQAMSASIARPRAGEPVLDLFANMRLITAAPEYDWVNAAQIWSLATVNLTTAKIHAESYMQ